MKLEEIKNENLTWSVYKLHCDDTPNDVYIGITNKTYVIERLFYHFVESVSDRRTKNEEKHQWIINNWKNIKMDILENQIISEEHARNREAWFVLEYIKLGKNVLNKTYLPVRCFDEYGNFYKDYPTVALAAKDFKVLSSQITQCITKKLSLEGKWSFIKYDPLITELKHKQEKARKKHKFDNVPILQYDKQGHFIKKWNNTEDIKLTYYISSPVLSKALRDFKKTAGGFRFMYQNGPIEEFIPIIGRNMISLYKDNKFLGSFYKFTDCADFLISNNYETSDRLNLAGSLSKSLKNNKPYKGYTIIKIKYDNET